MTFLCAWALCCAATRAPVLEFVLIAQQSKVDSPARSGPSASGQGAPAASSPEEEVLANLKQQAIGSAKVADLDMPDEYLQRVAGRILRASFEEHFRIVVPDEKSPPDKSALDPAPTKSSGGTPAKNGNPWLSLPWVIGGGIGVCGLVIAMAVRRARRRGAGAR